MPSQSLRACPKAVMSKRHHWQVVILEEPLIVGKRCTNHVSLQEHFRLPLNAAPPHSPPKPMPLPDTT